MPRAQQWGGMWDRVGLEGQPNVPLGTESREWGSSELWVTHPVLLSCVARAVEVCLSLGQGPGSRVGSRAGWGKGRGGSKMGLWEPNLGSREWGNSFD